MKPISTPMEKRIRMVRAWLDAAAKSYATKGSVKGNLHLFLAQAEMKQMNEGKPSIISYAKKAIMAMVLMGIIGLSQWWIVQHRTEQTNPVVETQTEMKQDTSVTVEPPSKSTPVHVETPSKTPEVIVEEPVSTPMREPIAQRAVEPTQKPSITSQEVRDAVQTGGRILRDE